MSNSSSAVYIVNESLAVNIPCDDTIPQSSEGTEILTCVLAASSASSRVRVEFDGWGVHSTSTSPLISALFVDGETNSRRASVANPAAAGFTALMRLAYEFVPGDTSEHTYRIRIGTNSGSMRMNGSSGGRLLGGASGATLSVSEV